MWEIRESNLIGKSMQNRLVFFWSSSLDQKSALEWTIIITVAFRAILLKREGHSISKIPY